MTKDMADASPYPLCKEQLPFPTLSTLLNWFTSAI
jgi:hypothetical protein